MAVETFSSLPILDLTNATHPDLEKRKAVAMELKQYCEKIGFFYVKNHGVDQKLVDTAFENAKTFFALPDEEKKKLDIHDREAFRGYTALRGENVDPANRGDMHEGFDIGPPKSSFGKNTGKDENVWPEALASTSFKDDVLAVYDGITGLTKRLFPLFALALGLDEHFFDDKTKDQSSIMRLLHYPAQTGPVDDRSMGIGAHTDYEIFTILAQQQGIDALQVKNLNGEWIPAPPIEGTFVCNLGDQLARWSNDTFVSTFHRAINRTGTPRYSLPYFCGVSYDCLIETIPTCITAERPNKYEPILAGEYVQRRLQETYVQSKIATGKA